MNHTRVITTKLVFHLHRGTGREGVAGPCACGQAMLWFDALFSSLAYDTDRIGIPEFAVQVRKPDQPSVHDSICAFCQHLVVAEPIISGEYRVFCKPLISKCCHAPIFICDGDGALLCKQCNQWCVPKRSL